MFQKQVEAIIQAGIRQLQEYAESVNQKAKAARLEVDQCRDEIESLMTLAKEVPEKVFDRYSNTLVATIQVHSNTQADAFQLVGGGLSYTSFRGLYGNESLKPGKYRLILLVELVS